MTVLLLSKKTHQYVVNFITNELLSFVGTVESRDFKRKINDLKQYRVESDYENIEVNFDKGTDAYKRANEIRDYVTKNFNV